MDIHVLVIGAGKLAQVRAEALIEVGKQTGKNVKIISVLSKHGKSAKSLAEKYECQSYGKWDNLEEVLENLKGKDKKINLALVAVPHAEMDKCILGLLNNKQLNSDENKLHIFHSGPCVTNMQTAKEVFQYSKKGCMVESNSEQIYQFYREALKHLSPNDIGEIVEINTDATIQMDPKSWYWSSDGGNTLVYTHLSFFIRPITAFLSDYNKKFFPQQKGEVIFDSVKSAVGKQRKHIGEEFIPDEVCETEFQLINANDGSVINCQFKGSFIEEEAPPISIHLKGKKGDFKLYPPLNSSGGFIETFNKSGELMKKINFPKDKNPFELQAEALLRAITSNDQKILGTPPSDVKKLVEILDKIKTCILEPIHSSEAVNKTIRPHM